MNKKKIQVEIMRKRLEASEIYSARISSVAPDLQPHILGILSPEEFAYCENFLLEMKKNQERKTSSTKKPEGLDQGYPFKD